MLAFLILLLTAAGTKAFANPACAVCTVAVGASLEIARRMGVDDGGCRRLVGSVSAFARLLDAEVDG